MKGETEVKMALRHIREGKAHIEQQRQIIANLREGGHPTADAEALLATFESAQVSHLSHLEILRSEGKLGPHG